jgi:hypothetical protein
MKLTLSNKHNGISQQKSVKQEMNETINKDSLSNMLRYPYIACDMSGTNCMHNISQYGNRGAFWTSQIMWVWDLQKHLST